MEITKPCVCPTIVPDESRFWREFHCAPSRCVLMTGLHCGHAYVRANKETHLQGQLPLLPETLTVARILKQAGYTTGAIGKWGLGGHPTIEPAERYIVTDAYLKQADTTFVRIRLIDLRDEKDLTVCTMPTVREVGGDKVMRVDGHPVWSRDFKKVLFQGTPDGRRQLFLADLSRVV